MHEQFLFSCSPWLRYSRKLIRRIEQPRYLGKFEAEEAASHGLRLSLGKEGDRNRGSAISLYLLVDESDGVIADAKFQAFGRTALIGAADIACELLIRKNYAQAGKISADLIDNHVRDSRDLPAFPFDVSLDLNLVLFAIEEAVAQCRDIPLEREFISTPLVSGLSDGIGYPGWDLLSNSEKISLVEEVIARDVRPYIELDEGGIEIVELIDGKELIISYQGACTTCYSATGSTLNAIQQILRAKISSDLFVTPTIIQKE
jgi:NifU-like protein